MNVVGILNTIRDNASTDFQQATPEVTDTNLQAFGNPILDYEPFANEFVGALVNRIAFTAVMNKTFRNPLSALKKGNISLGTDVQEIFTNPAKASSYDKSETGMATLLKRNNPDVKAAYHRRNRQEKYSVTIDYETLKGAFVSTNSMQSLITSIIDSMYNGNYIDEFELTKNLFNTAVANDIIVINDATIPTDEASGKTIVKQIKKIVKRFKYPSTKYNKYSSLEGSTGDPVKTFTNPEDVIIIIKSDIMADLDVDVLAVAFNIEKDNFMGRVFEVDEFTDPNLICIIADKNWVQVYDNNKLTRDFYNGASLTWNYWLHVWQTYSLSPFANAVALYNNYVAPSITSVTMTPDTANVAKGATQQFTSTVVGVGTASLDVLYSLSAVTSANTTINANGLLVVGSDETATSITVTAKSEADPTKQDTSTVTVTA